ncbi:hypothetical protein [Thermincola potens]|uniref:Uncharacterized protein n=1 Tax=Thermincola potens (strain JR) TaxID=635013 RepID=D5XER4_THEPJ|nr:hypothetical protein [Thermincola potens]ADG82135.1 hypothetical protein TherJR_1273 [Thermincola potens JR]
MGLALDKSANEGDKIVENNGIKYVIGKDIMRFASSFYIDYRRSIFGGGFRVFAGQGNSSSCC